ncbi:Imm1 family immunity protein [Sciscionella sediminilitoris]|uniref:Imm1 family immunity protein n=1 Tax=Sciscionella sediminilitoris TaxID=1445613 RepID=UPI003CCE4173
MTAERCRSRATTATVPSRSTSTATETASSNQSSTKPTSFPPHCEVPTDSLVEALVEFLQTATRPLTLGWQPARDSAPRDPFAKWAPPSVDRTEVRTSRFE